MFAKANAIAIAKNYVWTELDTDVDVYVTKGEWNKMIGDLYQ